MTNWLDPILHWFGFRCGQPTSEMPENKSSSISNDREASREFVAALLQLGYLSFVPPADTQTVKDQLIDAVSHGSLLTKLNESSSAYPGIYPDRRIYQADAEDLSEGIATVVTALAPILRKEGVKLMSIRDHHENDCVSLMIDDEEHLIYAWPNQEPPDLDTWGLGHKRLVEIVTELLISAHSLERLYWMGRGNDAHVILLTEKLFTFIRSASLEFDDYRLPRQADEMTLTHES